MIIIVVVAMIVVAVIIMIIAFVIVKAVFVRIFVRHGVVDSRLIRFVAASLLAFQLDLSAASVIQQRVNRSA